MTSGTGGIGGLNGISFSSLGSRWFLSAAAVRKLTSGVCFLILTTMSRRPKAKPAFATSLPLLLGTIMVKGEGSMESSGATEIREN